MCRSARHFADAGAHTGAYTIAPASSQVHTDADAFAQREYRVKGAAYPNTDPLTKTERTGGTPKTEKKERLMDGNGYIYWSSKAAEKGLIWSCNGAFAGSAVNLFFSDCDGSLAAKLRLKDLTGISKNQCGSIPDRAIAVAFDMGISHGVTAAVNVVEI